MSHSFSKTTVPNAILAVFSAIVLLVEFNRLVLIHGMTAIAFYFNSN
ncbi:hypothetical protein [Cylindrospermopsis raciborskii]|nr:hypothetical protein [Cylindrospermopsis raciborskii]